MLSGVLSHMGKHAMLLQTEDGGTIGEAATHFLDVLQPTRTHPSQQLFTFAWVLGQYVPDATMQELSYAIAVPARTQE